MADSTVDKDFFTVLICFGSNLDDSKSIIQKAIDILSRSLTEIFVTKIVQTEPVDMPENTPMFYNCLLLAKTQLLPEEFLNLCLLTEQKLGRVRTQTIVYENRTIDIDILDYNGVTWYSPTLKLPHKRGLSRQFVIDLLETLKRKD